MKIKNQILLFIIGATSMFGCNNLEINDINLDGSPEKVEMLGAGTISTGMYERDIAISAGGDEIIYTLGDYKQARRCLVQIKKTEGKWSEAKILNISGEYQDIEPFYALDGKGLYFASNRPPSDTSNRKDYNIWYSKRDGDDWQKPEMLGGDINTRNDEFYPSVSSNGNLYFTATRENGVGREDIFMARKIDEGYAEAIVLDSTVNTKFYEFNAYITPDENLLIFSSFGRPDDIGGGDLYYSQRGKDGKWKQSKNFGQPINSDKLDYCPFVDINNNNLYFTSERAKSITGKLQDVQELIDYSNGAENGMGDIYRIGMEQLKLDLE